MNTPECSTRYVTSIRTHNSQRTEHKYIDQMQTQILRKVQQNYERCQSTKAYGLKGHLQGTNGEEQFYNSNTPCYYQFVSDTSIMKIILA